MPIQLNNLTIKGGVAGSTFGDPYWSYVTALLHFDSTNGSTTIVDQKGGSYTLGTGAQISTTYAKFGGSSLSLVNGYLTGPGTATAFGTNDFTIEMYVLLDANPGDSGNSFSFIDTRPAGANGPYMSMG